ncbi:hypothetical protein HMPREF0765_3551 [Sphingobacterium spiritivorum ATCC 33300]|uniref:Uncharacterized protein n=1 Tax=Sphingobacterium spiritivorum ATCC 33300 TaxID=525372 RepID=C2G1U5_SPHSI|nr:hypothetical protein HMPREF0765_3551 [Sphingobacterium spiritivorum ATCC 33300]
MEGFFCFVPFKLVLGQFFIFIRNEKLFNLLIAPLCKKTKKNPKN